MKLQIEIIQAADTRYDLEVYGIGGPKWDGSGVLVTQVYESRKGISRRAVETFVRGAVEVAMDNLEGDGEPEVVEDEGVWGAEDIR